MQTADTENSIAFILKELADCDQSLDLIVLPECCNAPSACGDNEQLKIQVGANSGKLLNAVKETAVRCGATVSINLYCTNEAGLFQNTTLLFNRQGEEAARYIKQHLPVSEYSNPAIDHAYLTNVNPPKAAEVDGVRYCFLTCYDTYYNEFINRMAIEKPDIILIASLQRGERGDILEMQAKNCAFYCNSYVIRSSFSMGEQFKTGGNSMAVAPDGQVIFNFNQKLGKFDFEVENIHYKYCRANGYGQSEVTNDYFTSHYRSPWSYRVGGSGVKPTDKETAYPRLCAHRGFITGAPENTIPSIGVAVSMGACEVEIDVRPTKDGVLVISHDNSVKRLTGCEGLISEMTYEELMNLDPGKHFSDAYAGVRYATLEEVFAAFPRRTIFNVHVKPLDGVEDYRDEIRQIYELAKRYDCMEHFYIATDTPAIMAAALEVCPEVERCALTPEVGEVVVDEVLANAVKYKCTRYQTFGKYMTPDIVEKAHSLGLKCNLFYADDPEVAKEYLARGLECILTDNYWVVSEGTGLK